LYTLIIMRRKRTGQQGALVLCGLLGWGAACQAAETSAPRVSGGFSVSDVAFNVRVAAGYKDNVMLSHAAAQESPFILSGMDLFLSRLSSEGAVYTFMFTGEDTRFLTADSARKEQLFFTLAQARKDFASGWGWGASLTHFYQDQVLDISATELGLGAIPARGHGLMLRPNLRRALQVGTWAEVEFPVDRSFYAWPLDDYWEAGPRFILRHEYGRRSELLFSYGMARRLYDTREQATAGGELVTGSHLEFLTQKAELAWSHHWDARRHWQSAAKAGVELNHDNASGYFDYMRYQAAQRIRFRSGSWEVSAEGRCYFYDYDLQTVSDTDRSKRRKLGLSAAGRVEKYLTEKLKLFCEYEHERSRANVVQEEYRVNRFCAGLDWEF
jgi:hypothetical protein